MRTLGILILLFLGQALGQDGQLVYCPKCGPSAEQRFLKGAATLTNELCSWTKCAIYRVVSTKAAGDTTEFRVRRLVLEFDKNKAALLDFEDEATLLIAGDPSRILTRRADDLRAQLPPIWIDFFNRHDATWKLVRDLDSMPVKSVSRKTTASKDPLTQAFGSQREPYKRKGVVRFSGQLAADGSLLNLRFEEVMGMGLDETALAQASNDRLPVNKKLTGQRVRLDIDFDVY